MKKKILSIDGGALRGYFTIYILAKIEEDFDIKILDYFDFFAGVSTGAIIISFLCKGFSTKEVLSIYKNFKFLKNKIEEKDNEVKDSKSTSFISNPLSKLNFKDKIINDTKYFFGEKSLKDSFAEINKDVLLLTYDTNLHEIIKMANYNENSGLGLDAAVRRAFAFPVLNPEKEGNSKYLDPGIWINNPSFEAMVDLISKDNLTIDDIKILSFGHNSNFLETKRAESLNHKILRVHPKNRIFSNSELISETVESILKKENYLRLIPSVSKSSSRAMLMSKKFLDATKKFYEENKEDIYHFIIN